MPDSVFINRVRLVNYKSIARCKVNLGPLTYLVGANGAGKSNFLDAFRFTVDALQTTLDHALRDRGGIKEVRRRSSGHPTHFEVHFDFTLGNGLTGSYSFRIGAEKEGAYSVQYEECVIHSGEALQSDVRYRVENGEVTSTAIPSPPAAAPDRLYLVTASGLKEFRPVYEAFSKMAFFNLNPEKIRTLQSPDVGLVLKRDGSNLASVLERMAARSPEAKRRVEEYLAKVVPGIEGVNPKEVGPMETLEFKQRVRGSKDPWRFLAANMSDGTLRALGTITALLQNYDAHERWVTLVGIEEPEVALHPAAAGVLRDVLAEGRETTQIIVTSHSPDLLDDPKIDADSIFGVSTDDGVTNIEPIPPAAKMALREKLYTAGELLRLNQLTPDQQLSFLEEALR